MTIYHVLLMYIMSEQVIMCAYNLASLWNCVFSYKIECNS